MAVNKEYEIVSVNRVNDQLVRLGLAPTGRIAQYSGRAQDPNTLGVVGQDLQVDWPADDQPLTGEVMSVSYSRKAGK